MLNEILNRYQRYTNWCNVIPLNAYLNLPSPSFLSTLSTPLTIIFHKDNLEKYCIFIIQPGSKNMLTGWNTIFQKMLHLAPSEQNPCSTEYLRPIQTKYVHLSSLTASLCVFSISYFEKIEGFFFFFFFF
jgi:hypothetical protein